MNIKKILIVIIWFNLICSSYCQNNNKNFFPLNVGNKYVYYHSWFSFPSGGGSAKEVSTILRDTLIAGKVYYFATNFPFLPNYWIRSDTISGSLYKYDPENSCSYYDHEMVIDSLRAKLNEVTTNCITQQYQITCTDTSYANIFSKLRQKKSFSNYCANAPYTCIKARTYFDSIGVTYYSYSFTGGGSSFIETWELRGCILNGILYGDTSTIIGIEPVNSIIPDKFSLSQNYPNPFNPQTKIKFSIPLSRGVTAEGGRGVLVSLIVYDLLGREVTTLVNEELKPGTYVADWDGSGYSSGVYFYKLEAGDPSTGSGRGFVETKKMVLMK